MEDLDILFCKIRKSEWVDNLFVKIVGILFVWEPSLVEV